MKLIRARPSRWARWLFHPYTMRLLKRHFHAFHLLGNLPTIDPELPILLIPNHSTWWDGFFVHLLNARLLKRPLYMMMLNEQLAKYRFFSRVGAFGMEPKNSKIILQSLTYSVDLLRQRNGSPPMVCIFPQGELLPWDTSFNAQPGVDWIIKKYQEPVNLLCLAMRAEYLNEQKADVFALFGENHIIDARAFQGIAWLEKYEAALLSDLASRIRHRETGISLLSGSRSVNVKMYGWRGK